MGVPIFFFACISFVRNSGPLSRLCEKTSDVCVLNLFVSLFFLIITVSL